MCIPDSLLSASVVPVNNFEYTTPPPRLENITLSDRPTTTVWPFTSI